MRSWIDLVDLDPGSSGRMKSAVGRQSCTNTNIGLDGGPLVTPGVAGSFLMKVSSALIKSSSLSNSRVCSQLWEWVTAPRLISGTGGSDRTSYSMAWERGRARMFLQ